MTSGVPRGLPRVTDPSATATTSSTRSADGTTIAFDVRTPSSPVQDPLVVVVGGATNRRRDATGLLEALAAQGSHAYDEALKRGRAYGERAVRFTGDNKALALLLAGGVGFVLALAFKRR